MMKMAYLIEQEVSFSKLRLVFNHETLKLIYKIHFSLIQTHL